MANFSFLQNGNVVPLSSVDDKLRVDAGLDPDDSNFCMQYEWLVEAGMAVAFRTNENYITPEVIQKYFALKKEDSPTGEIDKAFQEFIEKNAPYLDGTVYQFTMWR